MYTANENKIETFRPAHRQGQGPSRVLLIFCLLCAIHSALPNVCSAANHYIRDGGDNNKSGNDWNEAWDDLPATLIRGDTYYIADGIYGGHIFNDPEDGEKYIYIKKAINTPDGHGTDVGWQTSFGDDSADFVFNNASDPNYYEDKERFTFRKGYYIFDGQVGGGPESWDSGYGFRIIAGPNMTSTYYRGMIFLGDGWSPAYETNYIEFRHIEITSPYRSQYDHEFAIYHNINCWPPYNTGSTWPDEQQGPQHIVISHCYIHDLCRQIQTVYAGYWTVEYNYFARNDVYSAEQFNQGTAWHDYGSDNITIRYNIFEDIDGTANIDLKKNHSHNNYDWEIYGNVFWNTPDTNIGGTGSTGVIGDAGVGIDPDPNMETSDMKIYNNAFVNINANATLGGYNAGIRFGAPSSENNKVYNNIWYNSVGRATYPFFLGVDEHDGNWYYNVFIGGVNQDSTLAGDETNGQVGTGDPFENWQAMNFNLTSTTDAGLDLGAPYDYDMFGNERGADGNWDRGALEYVSSDPNNQAPVLQAIGNRDVNEGTLLTFTVSATDPDGDAITYSYQNLPSGATLDSSSGAFSWTPWYDQAGSYEVTFIARDIHGALDSELITITVNNVNRPPDISNIPDSLNKDEGETINTFDIELATDPDGENLTYTYSNWLTSLPYTTTYDDAGTYTLHVDVSDGTDTRGKDITITVNNVNRAPILNPIDDMSAYVSEPLGFTVSATDPDGDAIIYSASDVPTGANFDPSTQSFTWTPDENQVDSYVVIFIASDGDLDDPEDVTITVNGADTTAPNVSNVSPDVNSIQAPLNTLIALDIEDAGKGVDADTVTIKINNNTIYTGDTAKYSSAYGDCYRIGTNANYRFIFQSNEIFDFDQTINVKVNAADLASNAMAEYSYSFTTDMRSFGDNIKVNSNTLSSNSMPVTVRDSGGNIWTAWHTGTTGSRDIYIGKLTLEAESFSNITKIRDNSTDQCNPVIAVDSDDKLYVAWQDNRNGNWDVYVSTSSDGINWSAEQTATADPNGNQINPAIVIDSSNNAYVVWEDDRNGNKDIYVAESSSDFITQEVTPITSDSSDQVEPAIAVDSDNTVYVVWTDKRNNKNDIYGATSNNGPWTNVAIVNNANNQSSPAIAVEASGTVLHLVWVDDRDGENDIYYANTSGGLPTSPLAGSSIIDDTTGADQKQPVIAVTGSADNNLHVFACWKDERNDDDDDLYLAEISSGSGTNVFVGDNSTNSDQTEPAIGLDGDGQPYLVWTDSRNTNTDIYYAGSTFIEPDTLASADVSISAGATIGTNPAISIDDVSVVVPAGAYPCDITISISKINNPLAFTMQCLGAYDFGPSNIEFTQPVTVTIPYNFTGTEDVALAYWYNSLTDELSQQGITDVTTITVSSTVHALRFNTTHFTPFYVFLGSAAASSVTIGGGGGGGGCSMSPDCQASAAELLLPYIGLTVTMVALKLRDRRKRKARNITKSGC